MNNIRLRVALIETDTRYWQLAKILGISVPTLNRRLRDELPAEEQERIIELIKQHKEEKE